ncbi:protein ABHD18 isoform X2 [Battus philenor]|uniref:protein ABHD18 isoform X2 n=1 Tax=Battus philenor TaxID=42288 RepID=UPI0035CF9670
MSASRLDAVYRSILITKFFTKGWGKPENLRRLFEFRKVVSKREECFNLVERNYPVTITKEQNLSDCKLLEGYFLTPLERYLPGIVPKIAQRAHFQVLLPVHWSERDCKPVCLHLAGTGDHYFWRRRNLMVKPLLKEAGIGGIILENPFYGLRKPTDQIRSSLHNVSDIFVMGGCLILESLVLFHWCERNGLGPLGVTGLSMGGHMASLAATNWPKPLVLVPCLSWSTASAVFLQGVMSHSINWDLLEDQYLSDGAYREKLSKMVTIVDEAFLAGKKFARTYSEKVETDTQTTAQKEKQENLINSLKYDSNKNVDITYKETNVDTNLINKNDDANGSKVELGPKVPVRVVKSEEVSEIDKLTEELKILLSEKKIKGETSDEQEKILNESLFVNTEADIKKNLNNDISNKESPPLQTSGSTITDSAIAIGKVNEIEKKPEKKSWNEFTSDLWTSLPFIKSSGKKIDISKIHWRDREALQFMRGIMDECTHLSNFSVPYDTSLIIAVCAKHDAYVPREDVGRLEDIWPGAEVRYVDAGHVSAYILHQSVFRACIKEAFERSKKKWKDGKHIE